MAVAARLPTSNTPNTASVVPSLSRSIHEWIWANAPVDAPMNRATRAVAMTTRSRRADGRPRRAVDGSIDVLTFTACIDPIHRVLNRFRPVRARGSISDQKEARSRMRRYTWSGSGSM